MSFILVGTNYKHSPIELREKLSFSKKRLKDALILLKESSTLKGASILSTCNRVEIYASVEDPQTGLREIEDFISRYQGIDKKEFSPYLYVYEQEKAVEHLFSVTCGLDSLVLGETQVLNQVKFSFLEADSVGFGDRVLRKVFSSAVSLAGRIQRETRISEGKVSLATVAIDFIKERIGTLSGKNILIVGVGKVTELVLKYLGKENLNVVFVSNRTFERAKDLASQIGAKAVRFDDLREYLREADVIITATASPHILIDKQYLEEALIRGWQTVRHKLLLIDLALPRDVDPQVKEMEGVDLFGLENLDAIIKRNTENKSREAEKAREIINREARKHWNELIERELEPALLP